MAIELSGGETAGSGGHGHESILADLADLRARINVLEGEARARRRALEDAYPTPKTDSGGRGPSPDQFPDKADTDYWKIKLGMMDRPGPSPKDPPPTYLPGFHPKDLPPKP
jgi:hypothetical protein